jgi:cbb3-type cytochrome oxidase maturation protein
LSDYHQHLSPALKIVLQPKQEHMSVIFLLLIASISVAAIFLFAFLWSVKNGQYDDETSPPMRILFDGDALVKTKTPGTEITNNSKP